MNFSGEYISDFDNKSSAFRCQSGGPIDFSIATKLEGNTGSTYDVYITQYHQTRVLIKKLKDNLKDKILYRNAMEKEFTLGFRLKHNCLPTYREFHVDYIIMEFVDGDNLASLIKRQDPFLKKEKNIRKFLTQLIEVIEYLHANGISHCDIKPDNIMITKDHHNVMLIDLDKTYTSTYNTSSGATSNFDVDESKTGHPDMDFHGIGLIIQKLGRNIPGFPIRKFKRLEKLCMGNNVQADDLLEFINVDSSLSQSRQRKKYILGDYSFFALMLLFLAGVGLALNIKGEKDIQEEIEVKENTEVKPKSSHTEIKEESSPIPSSLVKEIVIQPDYKKDIEKQMAERVLLLKIAVSEGILKLENPETTDTELRDIINQISTLDSEILKDSYSDFEDSYPNIDRLDIQMAVINSNAYKITSYNARSLVQKITDELIARNHEFYSNHPSAN